MAKMTDKERKAKFENKIYEEEDKIGKHKVIEQPNGIKIRILKEPSDWYKQKMKKRAEKEKEERKKQEEMEKKERLIREKIREIAIRELEKEGKLNYRK